MDIRQFVSDNDIRGPLCIRMMNADSPITFRSFSANYCWRPGWNVARCHWGLSHSNRGGVPSEGCMCGFYGLTSEYDMICRWRTLKETALVIAEGRGRIIMHENGFRAEKMRVVASIELSWMERFGNWQIGYKADAWKWARDYFGVPTVSAKYIEPLLAYQMDRV